MSSEQSRLARRWAARRVTNGLVPNPGIEAAMDPVVLTAAMSLLSDYEDAVYASCRHALIPEGHSQASEAVHLVEATRLHADVRRLRLEILDLIELSDPVPPAPPHS